MHKISNLIVIALCELNEEEKKWLHTNKKPRLCFIPFYTLTLGIIIRWKKQEQQKKRVEFVDQNKRYIQIIFLHSLALLSFRLLYFLY